MITKAEWHDWKQGKVTQKLIELIRAGQHAAVEELIAARGEVGDFLRGNGFALEEIVDRINTGEGIYSEVKND